MMARTISNLAIQCLVITHERDHHGVRPKSAIQFLAPIVTGIVGQPNIMAIHRFIITAEAKQKRATEMVTRQPAIDL